MLAKLPIDPRISEACDSGTIESLEGDPLHEVAKIIEEME